MPPGLDLKATDLADATGVGMYVYLGENASPAPCPDGVTDPAMCGLHLDGTASFDVSADSPADAEVIGAANERGLAMLFTGMRHFRH